MKFPPIFISTIEKVKPENYRNYFEHAYNLKDGKISKSAHWGGKGGGNKISP